MMVNYIVLGEVPDLQRSSVCRRHQEGILEEVMGAIEIGPSLQVALIRVSQLPALPRPGR